MDYFISINGVKSTKVNDLENIKDALYDLFGDIPLAMDDNLMEDHVCGVIIRIHLATNDERPTNRIHKVKKK
jgi:hypothetical protein